MAVEKLSLHCILNIGREIWRQSLKDAKTYSQSAFCSKLTTETLEQGVKYVQS